MNHGIATLIPAFINFALFVGFLFWKLRAPFGDFVRNRSISLRDELESSREQLTKARSQYEEFSAKLDAIESDIRALREQARLDAAQAQGRIRAETSRLSAQILADATATRDASIAEAKREIVRAFAIQVVGRAEGLLRGRLTGEEKVRIRREFSTQLGSMS